MGLSEEVEKKLIANNGKMTFEQIAETLANKYAKNTILDFLQNEKKMISFDGINIVLLKYPIQYLIRILENFISQTGIARMEVFLLGAFYIFMRRQFPDKRIFEIINSNEGSKFLNFDDSEISHISYKNRRRFDDEINYFFDQGWIEKLDSKAFYSFSKELYEHFINYTNYNRDIFSTPDTLVQLICKIIPNHHSLKVYNPAAGMLKLLTAISVNTDNEIKAKASEINPEIHKLGQLFAKTNGFDLNYQNIDSLLEVEYLDASTFDLVVSVPPFNAKIRSERFFYESYNDVALDIISRSLEKLADNGTAIFLVLDGVLFNNSRNYLRFRKEIINRRLIHTIVSLPNSLFYPLTSIKSSLLIFKKGINHKKVRFIDASSNQFYSIVRDKSISLDVDKIANLIYNNQTSNVLNEDQPNYGIPESLDFDFNQIAYEGFSLNLNNFFIKYIQPQENGYTELRKIVSQIKLSINNGFDLPFVRITDLNGGIIDQIIQLPKNSNRTKGKILSERALLIGTVGGSSKPSWYDLNDAVELSGNIVALKIDVDRAIPQYLLQEMNADYVQKQMEFLSIGSTSLKHLRYEDLLKIKVKLPSLQEQIQISQNRVDYIKQQSLIIKSSKTTITDADIFKAINHEVGNILKGPEGFIDLLPDFLSSNNISLDKPIVESKEPISVGEMIRMAGKQIRNVYDVMQNMKGILFSEKKYFKSEKTELKKYFREKFQSELLHRNVKVYLGIDNNFINPTSIYCSIDNAQFQFVVRNIITNAINHSGIDCDHGETLNLFVNIDSIGDDLEIHFMNNGNTFPSDFSIDNYLEFNKKTGNSTGQGLGGFLIGRVVENHSGKIRIQSEKRVVNVPSHGGNISLEANVDIVITIPKTK
jgi:signal transduction histidine kinase